MILDIINRMIVGHRLGSVTTLLDSLGFGQKYAIANLQWKAFSILGLHEIPKSISFSFSYLFYKMRKQLLTAALKRPRKKTKKK